MIHYMRHWNPAKEDQATDRSYRIGQQRDVHVYTPIVRGDGWISFDERLDELLDKKRSIASDILNGSEDIGAAEFADLLQVDTPTHVGSMGYRRESGAAATAPPHASGTEQAEMLPGLGNAA